MCFEYEWSQIEHEKFREKMKELEENKRKQEEKEKAIQKQEQEVKQKLEEKQQIFEQETECIICCDLLVSSRTLQCGHVCCHQCLEDWMKEQKQCPICRTPITSKPSRVIMVENLIEKYLQEKSEEDRREYAERKRQYEKWKKENEERKAKEEEEEKKEAQRRAQAQLVHNNPSPPRRRRRNNAANGSNARRQGPMRYLSHSLNVSRFWSASM